MVAAAALAPLVAPSPEQWPRSTCALYMFEGARADDVFATLMGGRTRLVFAAAGETRASVATRRVWYHGRGRPPPGEPVVHDAVMRAVGFTLVADGLGAALAKPLEPAALVAACDAWLATGALADTDSGAFLRRAFFVEVDEDEVAVAGSSARAATIARVLHPA